MVSETPAPHLDPDICEKLRQLQSRVQVWIKPTDRILTDADAYEYDIYRAEQKSGKISTQWAFLLLVFGFLASVFTYYTCFMMVSGQIDMYLAESESKTLFSLLGFHLFVFPGFAVVMGNNRVRKACGKIVGYCLLALMAAGVWWKVVFGEQEGGVCMKRC
ncbi:hypothetical protein ABW19_dt0202902 [Dactylella cylindrospora]|nr:hypothetical protein ABW19_dt0202902 [Dactylella cylindrospora]